MNIKRIQRIKQRVLIVGDMITLFSFMTLLCAFVHISLIVGIN